MLYVLLLGLVPSLLVVLVVYLVFGRERGTGYDREYEQEPPTDTQPALVPTLLRQGGEAGSFEFTATLFDLIRRGVYKATPTTTKKNGKDVTDLQLAKGTHDKLASYEEPVVDIVDVGNQADSLQPARYGCHPAVKPSSNASSIRICARAASGMSNVIARTLRTIHLCMSRLLS